MTRKQKISHIATHYGWASQSRQCIEEMAELTQAICKYERASTTDERVKCLEQIGEELADVEIMVSQLKLFLPYTMINVEKEIDQKLERQLQRIKEESTC